MVLSSPITAVNSLQIGLGNTWSFSAPTLSVCGYERKTRQEWKLVGGATTAQLYFVLQCPTSCINLSRTKSRCVSQPVYSVDWQQVPGEDGDLLASTLFKSHRDKGKWRQVLCSAVCMCGALALLAGDFSLPIYFPFFFPSSRLCCHTLQPSPEGCSVPP